MPQSFALAAHTRTNRAAFVMWWARCVCRAYMWTNEWNQKSGSRQPSRLAPTAMKKMHSRITRNQTSSQLFITVVYFCYHIYINNINKILFGQDSCALLGPIVALLAIICSWCVVHHGQNRSEAEVIWRAARTQRQSEWMKKANTRRTPTKYEHEILIEFNWENVLLSLFSIFLFYLPRKEDTGWKLKGGGDHVMMVI